MIQQFLLVLSMAHYGLSFAGFPNLAAVDNPTAAAESACATVVSVYNHCTKVLPSNAPTEASASCLCCDSTKNIHSEYTVCAEALVTFTGLFHLTLNEMNTYSWQGFSTPPRVATRQGIYVPGVPQRQHLAHLMRHLRIPQLSKLHPKRTFSRTLHNQELLLNLLLQLLFRLSRLFKLPLRQVTWCIQCTPWASFSLFSWRTGSLVHKAIEQCCVWCAASWNTREE